MGLVGGGRREGEEWEGRKKGKEGRGGPNKGDEETNKDTGGV